MVLKQKDKGAGWRTKHPKRNSTQIAYNLLLVKQWFEQAKTILINVSYSVTDVPTCPISSANKHKYLIKIYKCI